MVERTSETIPCVCPGGGVSARRWLPGGCLPGGCLPEGCLSGGVSAQRRGVSAQEVVCWGGGVCPGGCLPRGCLLGGVCLEGCLLGRGGFCPVHARIHAPLWTEQDNAEARIKSRGLPLLVNALHWELLMRSKRQCRNKLFDGFTMKLCGVAFWSLNCECELMQKQRRIFNYQHKITCLGNRVLLGVNHLSINLE